MKSKTKSTDLESLVYYINTMVKAAQSAGMKTYIVSSYEELYDVKCDFLDI